MCEKAKIIGRKPETVFKHDGKRYVVVRLGDEHCELCSLSCHDGWCNDENKWAGPCSCGVRDDETDVAFVEIPDSITNAQAKNWAKAASLLNAFKMLAVNGEQGFRRYLPIGMSDMKEFEGLCKALLITAEPLSATHAFLLETIKAAMEKKKSK